MLGGVGSSAGVLLERGDLKQFRNDLIEIIARNKGERSGHPLEGKVKAVG